MTSEICGRYSGCLHFETVTVHLPEALLEKRREKGLRLRLRGSGDGSDHVVSISPEQIVDQLSAARAESEKATQKQSAP